jgi:DNA-directed RNA polymerase subunit RPC12/RpoP
MGAGVPVFTTPELMRARETKMGLYPCDECGALFISVTMTQEPHAPTCSHAGTCARCGHSVDAHGGHAHRIGTPPPTHCSQGCGCDAYVHVGYVPNPNDSSL